MDKLIIEAFRKENFKDSAGKMTVQFNPAKVSVSWGTSQKKRTFFRYNPELQKAVGGSYFSKKVNEFAPGTANFDLIFDNTLSTVGQPVQNQINQLSKLCLVPDSEVHGTNYLILTWGKFNFRCQMTGLTVDYVLFMPDGTPLRAEVKCTFTEFRDALTKARAIGYRSPDMTRVVTVREGDTLPLLCWRHYGSERYYLQVARANNLTSPSRLHPGQRITFPPLTDYPEDYYTDEANRA